jgi:hypothetical protein
MHVTGREFAMSPRVNHQAVERVLAGDGSYDLLGDREQAVVRGVWAERVIALRESLNFETAFVAAGEASAPVAPANRRRSVRPTRTATSLSTRPATVNSP